MSAKKKPKYTSRPGTFSRDVDYAGARTAWFYLGEQCCPYDQAHTKYAQYHLKEEMIKNIPEQARVLLRAGYA
jgi:hypothetical protein